MRKLRTMTFSLFMLVFSTLAYAQGEFWIVKSEHFRCVQNNIAIYQAVQDDQVLIFLADCPETDIAKILGKRTMNSALPEVEKKGQSEEQPAEVMVLDKALLPCLARFETDKSASLVKIPKSVCE